MALGALWYGPLFGKVWITLSGINQQQIDASKKSGMGKRYAVSFAGALIMSFVIANIIGFHPTGELLPILMTLFWIWLGFIVPVTLGSVLWEQKSWKLWALNNAYQLIAILLIGTILVFGQITKS